MDYWIFFRSEYWVIATPHTKIHPRGMRWVLMFSYPPGKQAFFLRKTGIFVKGISPWTSYTFSDVRSWRFSLLCCGNSRSLADSPSLDSSSLAPSRRSLGTHVPLPLSVVACDATARFAIQLASKSLSIAGVSSRPRDYKDIPS